MKKPKRILLCRTGGIGDVIHSLPLVKFLRKEYEDASIEYLTAPNIKSLLEESCPYIDKVWAYDKKNLSSIVRDIKANADIDYFLNLHTGIKFFILNLLQLKAKRFFQYKKERHLHATLNFAMTYKKSIIESDLEKENLFELSQVNESIAKFNLQKDGYICFVPGVGKMRPNRMWLLENWIELAKNLQNKLGVKIVILGGEEEKELISYFQERIDDVEILINKSSLIETARLIAGCKTIISCDTGLIHIGSALSKNVIGLYGPTLSLRTGPFNDSSIALSSSSCPCRKSKYVEPKKCEKSDTFGLCMQEIKVAEVEEKVLTTYTNMAV